MKKGFRITLWIAAFVVLIIGFFTFLPQSCKREIKSIGSNWSGGLNRTLTVYDYNGDTIKTYTGKFDIRDDGADNQVFFDLDGKRVWIQGGIVISEEF